MAVSEKQEGELEDKRPQQEESTSENRFEKLEPEQAVRAGLDHKLQQLLGRQGASEPNVIIRRRCMPPKGLSRRESRRYLSSGGGAGDNNSERSFKSLTSGSEYSNDSRPCRTMPPKTLGRPGIRRFVKSESDILSSSSHHGGGMLASNSYHEASSIFSTLSSDGGFEGESLESANEEDIKRFVNAAVFDDLLGVIPPRSGFNGSSSLSSASSGKHFVDEVDCDDVLSDSLHTRSMHQASFRRDGSSRSLVLSDLLVADLYEDDDDERQKATCPKKNAPHVAAMEVECDDVLSDSLRLRSVREASFRRLGSSRSLMLSESDLF